MIKHSLSCWLYKCLKIKFDECFNKYKSEKENPEFNIFKDGDKIVFVHFFKVVSTADRLFAFK